jgi:hypothetical protein
MRKEQRLKLKDQRGEELLGANGWVKERFEGDF